MNESNNKKAGNAALLHYLSQINDMSKEHPEDVVNHIVAVAFNTRSPGANFNACEIAASRKFAFHGRLSGIDIPGAKQHLMNQAIDVVNTFMNDNFVISSQQTDDDVINDEHFLFEKI
ncbi:hypothetical protein [Pantoea agglomerans]|uniref:hypothetical protein n=1 Tax=Enterobacter agglomerans TaxID=549 RepID=UPI001F318DB7|nr:hypothetical protein [Pantoea agglomerans]UJL39717.1 hypothetical protein JK642_20905 [Pantoea agglomerans]